MSSIGGSRSTRNAVVISSGAVGAQAAPLAQHLLGPGDVPHQVARRTPSRWGSCASPARSRRRSCRHRRAAPRTAPGSPRRRRAPSVPSPTTSSTAVRLLVARPSLRAYQPMPPPEAVARDADVGGRAVQHRSPVCGGSVDGGLPHGARPRRGRCRARGRRRPSSSPRCGARRRRRGPAGPGGRRCGRCSAVRPAGRPRSRRGRRPTPRPRCAASATAYGRWSTATFQGMRAAS